MKPHLTHGTTQHGMQVTALRFALRRVCPRLLIDIHWVGTKPR